MQTFLPYEDFYKSLDCLDYKRLGKQRVESYQILRSLQCITKGWRNHPVTKMWENYENALQHYLNLSIEIWKKRGYKNTMEIKPVENIVLPHWLGNEKFHASHRAALLYKNFEFYSQYQWLEKPELNYFYV